MFFRHSTQYYQTCILTLFSCLFCFRMKVSIFQVTVAMEGMEEMVEILITAQLMHLFRVYWRIKFHERNNIWADNPHRPKIRLQTWQRLTVSFFNTEMVIIFWIQISFLARIFVSSQFSIIRLLQNCFVWNVFWYCENDYIDINAPL